MAGLVNTCLFTATAGGTTDWTPSSAVTGYMTPTAAGVVTNRVYKFRAESSDLTEWELAEGIWDGSKLVRTTVLQNSAGTLVKINFSAAPKVGIVAAKEDQLMIDEANAFTSTQKQQAQDNLGIRRVAQSNITWYVAKTGNDANTGFPTGVTSTITFTNGSANIGWTGHGRSVGDVFVPTNSGGALPTNFVSGIPLYVKTIVDPNTITASLTSGGAAITAGSAGSGTHTATVVSPLLTVQKALNLVGAMDMSIYQATIRVAGGQYDQALTTKPQVGGSSYVLRGNEGAPSNVILTNNAAGWGTFYVPSKDTWNITGFRITASGSNSGGLFAFNNAAIVFYNIEWGACGNYHMWCNTGGFIGWGGGTSVVVAAGTNYHMLLQLNGRCDRRGETLVHNVNPTNYSNTFIQCNDGSLAMISSMTFTNKAFATGTSHVLTVLSAIDSGGATELGGTRYLPGSVDGTKSGGSVWA